MSSKLWIKTFFITSFFLLFIVIFFNFSVDPYNIFNHNRLNKYKQHIFGKIRLVDSLHLQYNQYNTIIIGTSRTLNGIQPKHQNLLNAYNASVSGTNIFELEKILAYIFNQQKELQTIIYGVDFLTFSNRRMFNEQFFQSTYDTNNTTILLLFKTLSSFDTLKDSLDNLKLNYQQQPSSYINGYYHTNNNQSYNYPNAFTKILTNNFFVNPQTYGCYHYSQDRVKRFRDMLINSAKHQIKLKLFISPIHYRQLLALYHLGLFEQYLQWMEDITTIVKEVNQNFNATIELYDFSGINAMTTEKITTKMHYYWESSHYKTTLGNLVIDRLYNQNQLGTDLLKSNTQAYIQAYRKKFFDYCLRDQKNVLETQKLFLQTQKKREHNCKELSL
ncbi:MAG: hypothetical protein JXQ76_07950 [Campylobacterales bacterium]|nr:hypothetical protein [Campylobacterales bacterium]